MNEQFTLLNIWEDFCAREHNSFETTNSPKKLHCMYSPEVRSPLFERPLREKTQHGLSKGKPAAATYWNMKSLNNHVLTHERSGAHSDIDFPINYR